MFSSLSNIFSIVLYSFGVSLVSFLVFLTSFYSEITSEGPSKTEYDYIIVGAGSAGTVLFNEINDTDSVVIIEAGSMPNSFLNIPILTPILHLSTFDWSYETTKQEAACKAMSGYSCRMPSGKGFGGSNIINNMVYFRGHEEDFRDWFDLPDSYNYTRDIIPVFLDLERTLFINNVQHRTRLGEAILNISECENIKFQPAKVIQKDGMRWTIGHQCLGNLKANKEFITNALVLQIIFDENIRNKATGIIFEKNGLTHHITAKKGIILSAGAIGTPKILLQSGLGPCSDLENISISCRQDLPVGNNLQDHISTGLDLVHLNISMGLRPFEVLSPKGLYEYFLNDGKGPISTVGCEALGFTDNLLQPPEIGFMIMPVGIVADGGVHLRRTLNINEFTWSHYFQNMINLQTISILPIVLHPKSRGYIKLSSNNPYDQPLINPKYLTQPEDVKTLIKGLRLVQKIVDTPEMRQLGAQIYNFPFPKCEIYTFKSDEYWECYVRHLTLSVFHPVGTCRMGAEEDPETVVTRDFRVKGTDNLFVVDASLMPNLPSGNPNAAVKMIAKYFLRKYIASDSHRSKESDVIFIKNVNDEL